jgi:hypothetical protein
MSIDLPKLNSDGGIVMKSNFSLPYHSLAQSHLYLVDDLET